MLLPIGLFWRFWKLSDSTSSFAEWIAVARAVLEDRKRLVLCPFCKSGHLQIFETSIINEDKKYTDICIYCEKCSRHNVMSTVEPVSREG